jgi:FkbM family methyltransferase
MKMSLRSRWSKKSGAKQRESAVKELAKKLADLILPKRMQLLLRYYYHISMGNVDAEMFFVEKLLNQRRRFIDIGANGGIYSFHFSSSFKTVEAFEPLDEITYRLKSLGRISVVVHNVALSSMEGDCKLFIPLRDPSLASIEARVGPCEERLIKVKRLDDYDFRDVDLIKLDVEGHEESVLAGGVKTIEINRPVLIVEIEQRHIKKPIEEVFRKILSLGYDGFYLQNDELKSIDSFAYAVHQEPFLADVMDRRYVNNFIFTPCRAQHSA